MFLRNTLSFYIYYFIKSTYRLFFLIPIPDLIFLKRRFKKKMGYKLDLDNPVNFNEKLQWLKVYDRKDEYTDMVDKYKARKYLSSILGDEAEKYFIPLIFQTKNVKDLRLANMPEYPVIIKTNHDQGGYKIIWDKNSVNWHEVRMFFLDRLKWNFFWGNREWPYKNVERRVVIEKLLFKNRELPFDVKIYCFHGVIKLIQIANCDQHGNRKWVFLDNELNILESDIYYESLYPILSPLPQTILSNIDEMFKIAEKISFNQTFLRVDFFCLDKKIYIGELTMTPTAGYIKYFSDKLLNELGAYIDLKKV